MQKFEPAELAAFRDKDSRKPEYRELYEELPFIEAYSKHTDLRIEKDGPELAIGAKKDGQQDWDIHGWMQMAFLKSMGLQPDSFLVDIGCGTGRLASKAIPYLDEGKYLGSDISQSAIDHCYQMAQEFPDKHPTFLWSKDGSLGLSPDQPINIMWGHSVFTHLPPEHIQSLLSEISELDFGQFLFTFKLGEEHARTGLKQFRYSLNDLNGYARDAGLKAEFLGGVTWPASQRTMRITR